MDQLSEVHDRVYYTPFRLSHPSQQVEIQKSVRHSLIKAHFHVSPILQQSIDQPMALVQQRVLRSTKNSHWWKALQNLIQLN